MRIQSLDNQLYNGSPLVFLDLGALRAEMGTPSAFEEGDALAPCRMLARLFAFVDGRHLSRRTL